MGWPGPNTLLPLDTLAVFEDLIRHMRQLDIQDRERGNSRRAGPENFA